MRRNGFPHASLVASACLLALSLAADAAPREPIPYHELDPDSRLLATTPELATDEFAELLDRLERQGFTVPLAFVGAGVVVIDDPGAEAALRADPSVDAVWRESIPEAARARHAAAAGMLRWWNEGFATPEIAPDDRAVPNVQICAGAFTEETSPAPPILRCNAGTYGSAGKIHYAAGRIIVNLVMPKKIGGATWPQYRQEQSISELARALNWWSLKSGRQASFVINNWGAVPTAYEPATMPITDEGLYIADCLGNLPVPINGSCAYTMIGELNQTTKESLHGHWACTQFILDANTFPGSPALAYAYLGGPHTVALYGNGPLSINELDRVIAHEFGHIFQAPDEYSGGCGCGGGWGYFSTPNNNCADGSCTGQVGACIMRGSGEYTPYEMEHMEIYVNPCHWTRETVGLRDFDGNGILDVRETRPETIFTSALPETVETSRNVQVLGRTWDVPYPSPAAYEEDVTVNTIVGVQFSVSNSPWHEARAVDGYWSTTDEEFELRLPDLGGGVHSIAVRGVNSVWREDVTPARLDFFVYDVMLRDDITIEPGFVRGPGGEPVGNSFVIEWRVNGEDFESEYKLYRQRPPESEELLATMQSPGGLHPRFRYEDVDVYAGSDYLYRLDVHTPGKDPKPLGRVRAASVLPPASEGKFVSMAPNPFRDEVLFSVLVPRGPAPNQPDVPDIPGDFGRSDDPGDGGEDDPPDPSAPWRSAEVRVYDIRGRLVRDLGKSRQQESARFNVRWDGLTRRGTPTPPGVYFVNVDFGYTLETKKIVRVR
jgi:hypothetical protein